MAMHVSKTKKILPGVTLHLSTNGASVSVGSRAAKLKFSKRGIDVSLRISSLGLTMSKRLIGRK